jgi:hypothetical protein
VRLSRLSPLPQTARPCVRAACTRAGGQAGSQPRTAAATSAAANCDGHRLSGLEHQRAPTEMLPGAVHGDDELTKGLVPLSQDVTTYALVGRTLAGLEDVAPGETE